MLVVGDMVPTRAVSVPCAKPPLQPYSLCLCAGTQTRVHAPVGARAISQELPTLYKYFKLTVSMFCLMYVCIYIYMPHMFLVPTRGRVVSSLELEL